VCDGAHLPSEAYLENRILDMIDEPLPEPASTLLDLTIGVDGLSSLRGAVRRVALDVGLEPRRAADLVLAVNELAGNSIRHAGGDGTLRCWTEDGNLVCEVRDRGRIDDPLVGRTTPTKAQPGGRGVWMVHQLCDLVQLRTSAEGTVVRAHAHLG
jgi:anti-sigma regulatory factor (Ser/Thr protein kinase)